MPIGPSPRSTSRPISPDPELAHAVLEKELDLFEEDFLDLDEQSEVQRYLQELLGLRGPGDYGDHTRSRIMQEVVMGDQYRIEGQAGAVGPGAVAVGNEFVQLWNNKAAQDIDLGALAQELARLRAALKEPAVEPEQDVALSEVAKAEMAAKANDGPRALQHLKAAGRWALDRGDDRPRRRHLGAQSALGQ